MDLVKSTNRVPILRISKELHSLKKALPKLELHKLETSCQDGNEAMKGSPINL